VHFLDGNNKHFKELNDILQSVKSKSYKLTPEMKKALKQHDVKISEFRDFIDAVVRLNKVSLKDYRIACEAAPFKTITEIKLYNGSESLYHSVSFAQPKGYTYNTYYTYYDDNFVKQVAEGYVTTIQEPNSKPKSLTLKDGQIVEITEEDAKDLKPCPQTYINGIFDSKKFMQLLTNIEKETSLELNQ